MRRSLRYLVPVLVAAIAACGGAPASTAPAGDGRDAAPDEAKASEAPSLGEFVPTDQMGDRRTDHRAVLLPDGRVMVVGGRGFGPGDWGPPRHDTAEIYDPDSGIWTGTGGMAKKRQAHTADLLEDGRVFVTGGQDQQNYHKKTELWDPVTETWTAGPKMKTPRWIHASARLDDGRLLVVGGNNDIFALVASAELFDPASNSFSPAGSMAQARAEHAVTLLSDGRVLVTGSKGKIAAAEIYDPAGGEWSAAGSMSEWRAVHTATLLADGKVMVAGGIGDVASTDLFDPATGEWSPGAAMTVPRYGHTATVVDDGRVLFAGGNTVDADGVGTLTNSAEIYDP